MTAEAKELYCYVTCVKPFCDQVDEIVGKQKLVHNITLLSLNLPVSLVRQCKSIIMILDIDLNIWTRTQ